VAQNTDSAEIILYPNDLYYKMIREKRDEDLTEEELNFLKQQLDNSTNLSQVKEIIKIIDSEVENRFIYEEIITVINRKVSGIERMSEEQLEE
jgi:hypothetical protein